MTPNCSWQLTVGSWPKTRPRCRSKITPQYVNGVFSSFHQKSTQILKSETAFLHVGSIRRNATSTNGQINWYRYERDQFVWRRSGRVVMDRYSMAGNICERPLNLHLFFWIKDSNNIVKSFDVILTYCSGFIMNMR